MAYLNSPKRTVLNHGLENTILYNNLPLLKFQFVIRININPVSGFDTRTGESLVMLVKSVDLPGVTFKTDEANEYNRTRVVYTGVTYGESNIMMHDVADGKVLNFWKKYLEYHVADPTGIGFGLKTGFIQDNNRRFVIDSIDIYQFQAGKANRTTLMYPKITAFRHTTLDYSASELSEITFTVKPEYIKYKTGSVELPRELLDLLAIGAPFETFSESLGQVLSVVDPADIEPTISDELSNTLARNLNDETISASRNDFNQVQQQPLTSENTASSSLRIFGVTPTAGRSTPSSTSTAPNRLSDRRDTR